MFQFQRVATFGSDISFFIRARMSAICFSCVRRERRGAVALDLRWICAPNVPTLTVRGLMFVVVPVARFLRDMLPPCDS